MTVATADYVQDVYVDESYDKDLFVLSLCSAHPESWRWFRLLWTAHLDGLNSRLVNAGRKPISRYHATDCANRKRDFADWTLNEQIEITERLIEIILCCPAHCVSICVLLDDIQAAFIAVHKVRLEERSCRRAAYFIAAQIAADYLISLVNEISPYVRFRLTYDQGPEERMIILAIDYLRTAMKGRSEALSVITRENSTQCVPLQAADFIAYESFKDRRRELYSPQVPRRKSFAALLTGGVGISLRTVYRETIFDVVEWNAKLGASF